MSQGRDDAKKNALGETVHGVLENERQSNGGTVQRQRPRNDRQEARLLLAILAERWSEAATVVDRRPVRPGVFVDLCVACDVSPWVHHLLKAAGRFDLVGESARRRLEGIRDKCRVDNLLLLAMAERSIDLLLEAGIVPVVLKGLDVMHRFHDGFDTRTLVDVDLLVRPEQAARAEEILVGAGWSVPPGSLRTHWVRSSHHLPMKSPGPVHVEFELHWNLVQEERYTLAASDLFARAVPFDLAGRGVLRLDDHDHAAFLFLHHLSHYFDRKLKWALDLASLSAGPGFRWPVVVERLADWGGTAAGGLGAAHLSKLFPALIPASVLGRLRPSWWRRLASLPLRSSHPLDLFRATHRRWVQLFLAAVALERPSRLPAYLVHRAVRVGREGSGPMERAATERRHERGTRT